MDDFELFESHEVFKTEDDIKSEADDEIKDNKSDDDRTTNNDSESEDVQPKRKKRVKKSNVKKVKNEPKPRAKRRGTVADILMCDRCQKTFDGRARVQRLQRHMLTHTGEKPHKCQFCEKSYADKYMLREHQNKYHPGAYEESLLAAPKLDFETISKAISSLEPATNEVNAFTSNGEIIACPLCPKKFTGPKRWTKFKSHTQITHLGIKPYKCDGCNQSFTTKHRIKIHYCNPPSEVVKNPHPNEIYRGRFPRVAKELTCDQCSKIFTGRLRSEKLRKHMQSHTGMKPFKCNVCGLRYADKYRCLKHQQSHSDPTPFKCPECAEEFTTKETRREHVKRAHGDLTLNCDQCGKQCYNRSSFKTHMELHQTDNVHMCEICGMVYPRAYLLINHLKRHSSERFYKCPDCEKSFLCKFDLKRHVRKHLGAMRRAECDTCSKRYSTSSALRIHQRVHTGEKNYKCDKCERTFAQKTGLVAHERTHTGERPYACDLCDAKFAKSVSLKDHIRRIHVEKTDLIKRTFWCHYCDRTCLNKAAYTTHVRKVHSDKVGVQATTQIACEVCDKTFTKKSSLVDHMRVHRGEKPFVCEYCQKEFTYRSSWRTHTKSHSREVVERGGKMRRAATNAMMTNAVNLNGLTLQNVDNVHEMNLGNVPIVHEFDVMKIKQEEIVNAVNAAVNVQAVNVVQAVSSINGNDRLLLSYGINLGTY